MGDVAVKYAPSGPAAGTVAGDIPADLRRARLLAELLDSEFELAGIRFGLDALVGLVPVIGDTVALLTALYPLYLARKHALPNRALARMLGNLTIDYVGGLLPILGDVFDIAFKANLRNLRILEQYLATAQPTR
ncbi:DUF4112 domain-containing protein [Fontivita pretiosa]|uniref:DUF4112 domain-containing protein n=1 Tax=Fontivita pretiosa TaxID=2989684 RepID=UPI003D184C3D